MAQGTQELESSRTQGVEGAQVVHQPWCTSHMHLDDFDGDPAASEVCTQDVVDQGHVLVVVEDVFDSGPVVSVNATDVNLTSIEARGLAASLIRAAELLESTRG